MNDDAQEQNAQFANDLQKLLQEANADNALIRACGTALSEKNWLMGRLLDEMHAEDQLKLQVMRAWERPQITPAIDDKRLALEGEIAASIPFRKVA